VFNRLGKSVEMPNSLINSLLDGFSQIVADYLLILHHLLTRLFIYFGSLDLERSTPCYRDRVVVYSDLDDSDVAASTQTFCGSDSNRNVTATNSLAVVFESDDMVQGRGFNALLEIF